MFFKVKETILTPEINNFIFKYKDGINNSLLKQTIANEIIEDNSLYELQEEKYKLKLLDESQQTTQENKIQFNDNDIQEIVRSFTDILLIKESEMLVLDANNSEEFEFLIKKLLSEEFVLFPLTKGEKLYCMNA